MPMTVLVGEFRRLRKWVLLGLLGLVLIALAVGWAGDYRSCRRSEPVREALAKDAQIARESVKYWLDQGVPEIAQRARERAEVEDVPQLSCFRLVPGI